MNDQELNKAYDNLRPPHVDVKGKVLAALHGRVQPKSFRLKPLAAALTLAVCLLAPVMVYAASQLIKITIDKPQHGAVAQYSINVEDLGVTLTDKAKDNLVAYFRNAPDKKKVNREDPALKIESFEKAEELLELTLLKSDRLAGTNVYLESHGMDNQATGAEIFSRHYLTETRSTVLLDITLLDAGLSAEEKAFNSMSSLSDSRTRKETPVDVTSYTSQVNGITAELVYIPKYNNTDAYFVYQGVLYQLKVYYAESMDSPELVKELIDSFK